MAKYQSKYTGEEIDSILDGSKQMMESPVTKESLGLDKVDNTPDSEKLVAHANYADRDSQGNIFLDYYATKEALNTVGTSLSEDISTVESIAKGANQAVAFNNYSDMVSFLNGLPASELSYKIGQNIMIVTLEVPDLWVMDVMGVSEQYTYTSDEDFVNELKTNGYVRVGYYILSPLETQKVNLSEYAKKAEIGDRSQLYDSPNNDLVTAINHAWNNGESARGIAENAQNSADSANIALDTLKNGLTSGDFLVGNSQHADRADMDSQGNIIHEHYATKISVDNIINGNTMVGRASSADVATRADVADNAYRDRNGNNIEDTYATKGELPTKETLGLDKVDNTPDIEKLVAHANYADQDSNGNIFLDYYATKAEVGNIETALDNIIAIQNTLIGGGSV